MNPTNKGDIHKRLDVHNKIAIRSARKSDAKEVAQLLAELCAYEGVRRSTFSEKDFLRDGMGLNRVFSSLVAEVDGKLVGFLTYYEGYDMPSACRGHHLGDFFVQEKYRRLGVGTLLFKELAKVTLARGFPWVSWTVLEKNDPAKNFYLKLGAILRQDVKFMAIGKMALGKLTNPES